MKNHGTAPKANAHITIRVSGKLFQGHLSYLDQLVRSATDCHLWPVLNLAHLEELDRSAAAYLIEGENRDFDIANCPGFVRDWLVYEGSRAVA